MFMTGYHHLIFGFLQTFVVLSCSPLEKFNFSIIVHLQGLKIAVTNIHCFSSPSLPPTSFLTPSIFLSFFLSFLLLSLSVNFLILPLFSSSTLLFCFIFIIVTSLLLLLVLLYLFLYCLGGEKGLEMIIAFLSENIPLIKIK